MGDGLGHCGHVYSDMSDYDAAAAQEKAKDLVQFVRQYWMRQDQEQMQQPKPGPFLGFVLLSTAEWDVENFKKTLKEEWEIECTDESREDGSLEYCRLHSQFTCCSVTGTDARLHRRSETAHQ